MGRFDAEIAVESTATRRIGAQAPLGFAAGIPLFLTGATLTAWLENQGVSIEAIGLFALVSLPYNLKFLWAPLFDRYRPPFGTRRRGWMLLLQLAVAVCIAVLGMTDARGGASIVAIAALMLAFSSATHDIVADAYRTDVLPASERGRGTSAYVVGYRIALIVAGAGALVFSDVVGWRATYLLLSGTIGVGMIATWLAPAAPTVELPSSLKESLVHPLRELFSRKGVLWVLLFVALYRIGDTLANHFVTPFLLQIDFTNTEVGLIQKGGGMAATMVGVLIGGLLVDRLGAWRSLLMFGVAQAFANLGYMLLALGEPSLSGLATAIVIDNLCNGLGTAAFVAFLMSLCDRRFSATQYALLTSASTLVGRLLAPVAAFAQLQVGWTGFFAATILVAIPALVILLARRNAFASLSA